MLAFMHVAKLTFILCLHAGSQSAWCVWDEWSSWRWPAYGHPGIYF